MGETQKTEIRVLQAAQHVSDVHSSGKYLLKYQDCSCGFVLWSVFFTFCNGPQLGVFVLVRGIATCI